MKIQMYYDKCDICGIKEHIDDDKLFTVCNDICNKCFKDNDCSLDNFKVIDDKWVVRKTKLSGDTHE